MERVLSILLLIGLVGCKAEMNQEEIMVPFAGATGGLSKKQIEKNISKPLKKSTEKILKKLDKSNTEESKWELTRLSVGLFFVLESELTSVYKLEVEPSVELRFQQL